MKPIVLPITVRWINDRVEYDRQYRALNKDKIKLSKSTPKYLEQCRIRTRKWYSNPENVKRHKLYRKNNPEKVKEWRRNYYQKHKESIKRKVSKWKKLNNLKVTAINKARSVKIKSQLHHRKEIEAIYHQAEDGKQKMCTWCKIIFSTKAHVDPIIPISKGGKHEPSNLCISCPPCNLKKAAKLEHSFIRL